MRLKPGNLFRFFATAEVFTWAALLLALAIRSLVGVAPEVFFAVGASHGFTFLGFGVVSVLVGINQRWPLAKTVFSVSLAIIPFATLPFHRRLERRGYLEGNWRTTASNHPRDKNWFDRLFRWFIARPILLALVLIAGVVALFSFLLWLGPPSEWGN